MTLLDDNRLFDAEPKARGIAQALYAGIKHLPLVSPHGHTEPRWYAENDAFPDPAALFVVPDHYIFRMLYSQGVKLEDLGIPRLDGGPVEKDPRKIWRLFASHYHLFRATPTRIWLDHAFETLFGLTDRLSPANADHFYNTIDVALKTPAFRPRALFEAMNIEVISTTDSALDDLKWHKMIRDSGWKGRVVPAYRPDAVVDPEAKGFAASVAALGVITGEDTSTWKGYLAAHRSRRAYFKSFGATSSDHGHPSAATADLGETDAAALFGRVIAGPVSPADAETFRAQMLTEMARMSIADGLVLQIHPGSSRNHNHTLFDAFGPNMGADIPSRTDYVKALKPLLDRYGNDPRLSVILFTLDETGYARELAPLAGHYPCLKLGPAWWFFDAPDGMLRYRELTTETAGFYNTVGFNDDTRAFPSIPARHDVARRIDCAFLASRVATHRMDEDEAFEVAHDLAYRLAKEAYRL